MNNFTLKELKKIKDGLYYAFAQTLVVL